MGKNGQIDLASASPFRVGLLRAEPALRQASSSFTTTETLQPRVMQVLVALARANGGIVSRDELVAHCWEGRIVGDDSINRVISRLRRLSEERAAGSFQIETITKVGYRLVGEIALLPGSTPRELRLDAGDDVGIEATATPDRRWRRRWTVAAFTGAALVIVVTLWRVGSPAGPTVPSLAVATLTSTPELAETAQTLQSAIVSAIPLERFRIVPGPGSASDYRLTGRVVSSPDGLTLFAQLNRPERGGVGDGAPIWTPQKHFAANASLSGVASEIAASARCIVGGAEAPPVEKPAAAIAGWASYCERNATSDWNEDPLLEALRATTRAEPRFVLGQVTLASALGYHVMHNGGRDPDDLRAEAVTALAAAEKHDPDNATIFLTRVLLTPLEDFKSREALIRRALRARTDGSGDEFNALGYFLESVGRLRDAVQAYDRVLTIDPTDPTITMARAEVLSMLGRYHVARPAFVQGAATQPDRTRVDRIWLTAAITGRDWTTAQALIPTVPDDQVRKAITPLIRALATDDGSAAHAAGAVFRQIAVDTRSLSALTVMTLAWSGDHLAAIDAAERRFHSVGYNNSIAVLYSPGFAAARRTPEFREMATRIGLFRYWRLSGHPPDLCMAADAPALCAELIKSVSTADQIAPRRT